MRIAVYGKLRAGKSAICDFIKENYEEVEILDFGDALKECVAIAYPDRVQKDKKDRNLLIKFGQHLRDMDSDIWVNALKHRLINSRAKNIIVTGVRQSNEYEMLKRLGFTFIKVEASKEKRLERCLANGDKFTMDSLEHGTETELDNFEFDYLIENERGFKELEIDIRNVIADIELNDLLREEWN